MYDVQVVHPQAYLCHAQLVAQGQVALGDLGLFLEGLYLQLQLLNFVVYAQEVLVRPGQAALGLLLAVAVAGYARGLLKHLAALGALAADYLGYAALADDRVSVPAHAGVHEQLVHVAQAYLAAVDVILALSRTVILAGDGDLLGVYVKKPGRVVQDQRHLRHAHAGPFCRAAEDDVLHLPAAQRTAALLAHDPQNGVGNIRFAGTVGPHDGGYIPLKREPRAFRKALEALDFQCL